MEKHFELPRKLNREGLLLGIKQRRGGVPSERRLVEGGVKLKQLAAERVLTIQNGSGVSHIMKEGPIIEKLVALEEVAVKVKVTREEEMFCQ